MTTLPSVTLCPPSPERPGLHFDRVQYAARRQYPVYARFVGVNNAPDTNGFVSNGLSYGDYGAMSTRTKQWNGVGRIRRLETPAFMLDEKRFRSLMIRFLEIRVGLLKTQLGTETERMRRVSARLKQKAEATIVHLDKFCALYVAATDDAERKMLQRRISEYDSAVRIYREPWVIAQIARTYYLEGLDSVGVSARVGFKHPHIRQILYRLSQLDAEMQAGTDVPARGTGRPRASHHGNYHARHHVNRGIVSPRCALCAAAQPQPVCQTFNGAEGNRKMTVLESKTYAGFIGAHKRHHVSRNIVSPTCSLCRAKGSALPGEQSACVPSFLTSFDELYLQSAAQA